MKVKIEYAKRALADLVAIAEYFHRIDEPIIAAGIEARIREVVDRIASAPESAPRVA